MLAGGYAEEIAKGKGVEPSAVLCGDYGAEVGLEAGTALSEEGFVLGGTEHRKGMFGREGRGRGRADGLCEFGVEVGEFGVTAPHLPGADVGLDVDAEYDVRFGFDALFVAAHVDGLDGGRSHGQRQSCHCPPATLEKQSMS